MASAERAETWPQNINDFCSFGDPDTDDIRIGNAPCSWGVEFADDPRNPRGGRSERLRRRGLQGDRAWPGWLHARGPGAILGDGLAKHDLTLIGGVVFRPYHDPHAWDDVLDATHRTARALKAHGAEHLGVDRLDLAAPRAHRGPG